MEEISSNVAVKRYFSKDSRTVTMAEIKVWVTGVPKADRDEIAILCAKALGVEIGR